jgi:uncharacterized protein YsxB (DUF464 family)
VIHVSARLSKGHTSIEVTGHEGHVLDGNVCAGVTWITQAALLGLESLAELNPDLVSFSITQEE